MSLLNLCGYGFLPSSRICSRRRFLMSVYFDGSSSSSSATASFFFSPFAGATAVFFYAAFSAAFCAFFLAVCLFFSSFLETHSFVSSSKYSLPPSALTLSYALFSAAFICLNCSDLSVIRFFVLKINNQINEHANLKFHNSICFIAFDENMLSKFSLHVPSGLTFAFFIDCYDNAIIKGWRFEHAV